MEELLPLFEEASECRVDLIAVGSGAALRLGEKGDVDVLIVHAREAEEAFMAAGHGIRHEEFMINEFVLLGPVDDPAGIKGVEPVEALRKIAARQYRFVSRDDESGTHKRERSLWQRVGNKPDWSDYIESGEGMGQTLMVAHEKQGYVLSDLGTYLKFRDHIDLIPLTAHSKLLNNPYSVLAVDPKKHSKINAGLSDDFIDFLLSDPAQRLIANFKIDGELLFLPTRISVKQPRPTLEPDAS
jgi:tungstate transport system substrate-binding protein